ncbi:hypothetical protein FRC04_000675 [Tulasnella sp. 424]|nr:hypothetical protein FRC04_000675 [Tulasnella sp. 424]
MNSRRVSFGRRSVSPRKHQTGSEPPVKSLTLPPPRILRIVPKRADTGLTQLSLNMRSDDGYPAWLRRSALEGANVGLGFTGADEILVTKSKLANGTTREQLDDLLVMPSRPPSGFHSSFSEPPTPSCSSIRWSSCTSPLTPTTPPHQHPALSLANAEAEIAALKLALSASSTLIKNVTKEKCDAVMATRRLVEILEEKLEAEHAWLSEKAQLEERIKTLETVAAILDAEGQSLWRQTAHDASEHGELLLESMGNISADTSASEMQGPQGPLEALRKLDPNFRISSPSPLPKNHGDVLFALENIGSALLDDDISPSPSLASVMSEGRSLYSAPSVYDDEHSYTGPPLPTSGRAVDFILSFLAENSPSSRDLSRIDELAFQSSPADRGSVSRESGTDDDMDFDGSSSAGLSFIADVSPLRIAPRSRTCPQAQVHAGPQGESIFATAEDLQESMERIAAALGRPRTAGLYLEEIDEEDAEIADPFPVLEEDPTPESNARFSGLIECAARAACKRRAEAEVTKTKCYFDALRNASPPCMTPHHSNDSS